MISSTIFASIFVLRWCKKRRQSSHVFAECSRDDQSSWRGCPFGAAAECRVMLLQEAQSIMLGLEAMMQTEERATSHPQAGPRHREQGKQTSPERSKPNLVTALPRLHQDRPEYLQPQSRTNFVFDIMRSPSGVAQHVRNAPTGPLREVESCSEKECAMGDKRTFKGSPLCGSG